MINKVNYFRLIVKGKIYIEWIKSISYVNYIF